MPCARDLRSAGRSGGSSIEVMHPERSLPDPDVESYLAGFLAEVRDVLERIRETLHSVVPGAEEAMRYGVPTLRVAGRNVVHFGGYARHVAVYPVPEATGALAARIAEHRAGKGTLRFPLDRAVPYELIAQVGAALAARSRAR